MKTRLLLLWALASVQVFGQPILRQATDAEAAAGANVRAYMNPAQVAANAGGGPTNGQTAAQVNSLIVSNNTVLTNLYAPIKATNAVAKMLYMDAVSGGQADADGSTPWRAFQSHFAANQQNQSGFQWNYFPGTYPTNTGNEALTNNIWFSTGALIAFNRVGHLVDLWGNFEMVGGTLFDADLANASLHYPLYIQDVTSTIKLKNASIYGLSDCWFKSAPGADSTNFTVLSVESCTFTSKWDTMVFLNFFSTAWGSNYVKVVGSEFRAEGDTNFYSSQDGTGGSCVHLFQAPGTYEFSGDIFHNRNDGSSGTFGINVTGSNTVVNVSGCIFDIASTNGPAYWLHAESNSVINYFGSPLAASLWKTNNGGVINFIQTDGSGLTNLNGNLVVAGSNLGVTATTNTTTGQITFTPALSNPINLGQANIGTAWLTNVVMPTNWLAAPVVDFAKGSEVIVLTSNISFTVMTNDVAGGDNKKIITASASGADRTVTVDGSWGLDTKCPYLSSATFTLTNGSKMAFLFQKQVSFTTNVGSRFISK